MSGVVGADHMFHEPRYAREWADRFVPTPERLQLFDTIIGSLCESALPGRHIIELGVGPGYLASRILERISDVTYEGLDFSGAMLEMASDRLSRYSSRVRVRQADLLKDKWTAEIRPEVGAIVSTWALHDLGGETNTAKVYRGCRFVLPTDGVLLNGDFVKPDGARQEFEAGRFEISRHLEILQEAGFRDSQCLVFLEKELKAPTPANNYACFRAVA